MLHAALPFVAEEIETQAVVVEVGKLEQLGTETDPLVVLQEAFEYGVLHALSVVEAGLGDTAQAALAVGGGGGNIVADEDEHEARGVEIWNLGSERRSVGRGEDALGRRRSGLPPLEGRIRIEIAAEVAGEEEGLGMEEKADGDRFAEKRVVDLLLLALLPGGEDFFASVVG